MLQLLLRPMAWFLIASLLFPAQVGLVSQLPAANPSLAPEPTVETPVWTLWGADQYALAGDSTSIWIGAVGGVVRWDKQAGTYRRYSRLDGLPHTKVLAVGVDAAGNRWFGGDGGLSRLDAAENWTNFQSSNSGLHSDHVDGIAVVNGDTLYVSHGLPDGSVSRRDADGAWRWYPNREAAIQADYATVVQKRDSNALWTVAGSEIWSGSSVFDGQRWVERTLPGSVTPSGALAVDSRNHVWALSNTYSVFEWNGVDWLQHPVPVAFTGRLTSLAVDQNDSIWVGMQERVLCGHPYCNESATVKKVDGSSSHYFSVPGPVVALLSTSEGLWGIGPSWVMTPGFEVTVLPDTPGFQRLSDVVTGRDGLLWLYSGIKQPYSRGAVQTLDDGGTLELEDDAWQVHGASWERVTAFERAVNDIWYASLDDDRFASDQKAVRYHSGERIEYRYPFRWEYNYPWAPGEVSDIFAQDERHVWFALPGAGVADIVSLDDGGTPAERSDDTWRTVPIEGASGKISVAVDAGGNLWHGEVRGLYRYDGSTWQGVYGDSAVCDLVPAQDGTLYVQVEADPGTGCTVHSDKVVIIRPDGKVDSSYPKRAKWVVRDEEIRVRTASRRNGLWTVAIDGTIWYIDQRNVDPGQELQHRTASGLETYSLPVTSSAVQRLEVDRRGHVWVVSGNQLWRMEGPRPSVSYLYLPLIGR